MADNWEVGDLALCINVDNWYDGNEKSFGPSSGSISNVRGVGVDENGSVGLWLEEYPGTEIEDGFCADFFRKIHPLTEDEHRETIIELSNDRKVPARV